MLTKFISSLFEVGESTGDQGAVQTMHRVWILAKENTKLTIPSVLFLRVHQPIVKVKPAMLEAPFLFSKLNRWKAVRSRRNKVLCQNVVLFVLG